MNKVISWKTDEHFNGDGTEYFCSPAYVKFEDAIVNVFDKNREIVTVSINDPDFNFIFYNKNNNQWDNESLLLSKKFVFEQDSDEGSWILVVEKDENLKKKIYNIFSGEIEGFIKKFDVEVVILNCSGDFTDCLLLYGCNAYPMKTETFIKCVEKI